jgi:hypothetical protein
MANYRITNITDTAGKRAVKFNATLDINYIDSMMKKTIKVKPGETVYLQISKLPLSVQQLRVKRLISVVEISDTELRNCMNALKPVIKPMLVPLEIVTATEEELKIVAASEKRKTAKKLHEVPEN